MSISTKKISEAEWSGFLQTLSLRHHGWLTQLETHDRVTGETVTSPEMPLQSVEFDLEDQRNPRVNVTVQFDNKLIKHILFRPSKLSLNTLENSREVWLRIETVNTTTTVRWRPPASNSKR